MRPKGGKYLVQFVRANQDCITEISCGSLKDANNLAENETYNGSTSIRIINTDDIRMPKRSRKERS